MERRVSRLEGAFEQVNQRFADMRADFDARFADMRADFDARFADMRADFAGMRADTNVRFETMDRKIDTFQWRITALIVGTWITTIATVLLHR